ncbi:hypothetical protein H6G93_19025 [Nostoc sp. FACHB-973]|nr:hypothetical protein [Nostoc sp. FACHB-973]
MLYILSFFIAISSCVRSSRETSFCIHPFVVMGGDRPTNESNRSGGDGDRFSTGTKYDQLWITTNGDVFGQLSDTQQIFPSELSILGIIINLSRSLRYGT